MDRLIARLDAFARRLGHTGARRLIVAVGVLLVLPSLGTHYVFDDSTQVVAQRPDPGIPGFQGGPTDLFVFSSGRVEDVRALVEQGFLAWWTHPQFKNAFFRPLSSLTHVLDETLWPGSPMIAHVHTIAWYALLLTVLGAIYRRLVSPPWVAGLALLVYAVDDAHGQCVGWNANRNAIVAGVFALLALWAHVRWRTDGRVVHALLASTSLVVGLLAGESAVGVCAYLFAYAAFLDRGPLVRRLTTLVPYAVIVVAWRLAYRSMGYGSFGSDAYLDPGSETAEFLAAMPKRFSMLLMGQLGAPGADTAFFGPPHLHWLLWLAALATVAVVGVLVAPIVRRSAEARFWSAGMLLAVVPMTASFPSDRNLLLVGVGAAPLLATLFAELFDREDRRSKPLTVLGFGLVTLHLVVAPVLLPLRARSVDLLGRALARADRSIPEGPDVGSKTLVLVNVPLDQFASWLAPMRARRGAPGPEYVVWLSTGSAAAELRRVGADTLRVEPERGYLYSEPERLFRGQRYPLAKGDEVDLPTLSATIADVGSHGRPTAVEFSFDRGIDSGEYLWMTWQDGRYVDFTLPEVGRGVSFPSQDFVQLLIAEAFRGPVDQP